MKKIFIAALAALSISVSAFAASETVSNTVRSRFAADFDGATAVSWKTTAEYAKASFVLNGEKTEAFYNLQGELVATAKAISANSLPKKALETIAKKYAGYSIKETVSIQESDNVKQYVSVENENSRVVLEVGTRGEVSVFSKTKK